jgi:hypothetical protein
MKSNITINAIENTITISKAFYKKASVFGSAEYKELRSAIKDNPTAEIIFKTSDKKTYKALTFKVMEAYIKTQTDSEMMLAKFEAVQRVAKAKGSLYPLTKQWFLKSFPAYKENEVSEAEAKNLTDELTLKAAAEAEKEIAALIMDEAA